MNARRYAVPLCAAALAAANGTAVAQAPSGYHTPPKLIKAGTNTSPIAGAGIVVVQVFVNPDGTFKVTKIIKSTNHGDDAAALEIAKTSTYSAAKSGDKKVAEFYDYTLKFTAPAASTGGRNGLDAYEAEINARKCNEAKSGLTTYLGSHPDDTRAAALLGVSNVCLNEYTAAASAFNKVPSIPADYRTIAAKAYAEAATAALSDKQSAAAVNDAMKANQLSPSAATANLLGNAQIAAGDSTAAIHSFEQARSLSANDTKMDLKQRATIDANLAAAYVSSGDVDKAAALLPEIKQFDPSNTVAQSRISNYYATKADAAQKSGDYATAAGLWEKAAAAGGQYAPWMYANEAFAYMQGSKPDWKSAKAAADKAIALKPDDAQANLAEGVALAGSGRKAEAIPYLQKADASAKAAGETSVASQAEQFLKQLGAAK